jgi:hypothetical protein
MTTRIAGEIDGRAFSAEWREPEPTTGTRGVDGHTFGPHWYVTYDGVTRVLDDLPDDDSEWAVRDHIAQWVQAEVANGRWHAAHGDAPAS